MRKIIIHEFGCSHDFRFEAGLDTHISHLIQKYKGSKIIVFCSTRTSSRDGSKMIGDCQILNKFDNDQEIMSSFISGLISQENRTQVWNEFRTSKIAVLFLVYGIKIPLDIKADLVILKGCMKYSGGSKLEEPSTKDLNKIFAVSSRTIVMLKPISSRINLEPFKSLNFQIEIISSTHNAILKNSNHSPHKKPKINPKRNHPETSNSLKVYPKHTCPQRHSRNQSHLEILKDLCNKIPKVKFRNEDANLMKQINESDKTRFPIQINNEPWEKAFLAIQQQLGHDNEIILSKYVSLEFNRIFKAAKKIMETEVKEFAKKKIYGQGLLNAIELEGTLNGGLWHDGQNSLAQVKGLGTVACKLLSDNGINELSLLRLVSPSRIQMILRRNPPFGHEVLKSLQIIPELSLDVALTDFEIKIKFSVRSSLNCCRVHLLAMADGKTIHYLKINSNQIEKTIDVNINKRMKRIVVSLMCSDYATINIHKIFELQKSSAKKSINKFNSRIYDVCTDGSNSHLVPNIDISSDMEHFNTLDKDDGRNSEIQNMPLNIIENDFLIHKPLENSFFKEPINKSHVHVKKKTMKSTRLSLGDNNNDANNFKIVTKTANDVQCAHRCKNKQKCKHECCKNKISSDLTDNLKIRSWLSECESRTFKEQEIAAKITFSGVPESRLVSFESIVRT